MSVTLNRRTRWLATLSILAGVLTLYGWSDISDADVEHPADARIAQMTPTTTRPEARWYSSERVARGKALFAAHCAACHGASAQGAFNWRQRDDKGKLPPPPLNGTGHAWHHPLQALGYQIKFALPGGSGSMPPFKNTLSDEQIVDTIAWFQSLWSDEIYTAWMQRQQRQTR